jgi:hypothetical protein
MAFLCKEALRPAGFVVNSTPESYLNAMGHAFSQVRWLSMLPIKEILDATCRGSVHSTP